MKIGQVLEKSSEKQSVIMFGSDFLYHFDSQKVPSTNKLIEDCDRQNPLTGKIQSLLGLGYAKKIAESEQDAFFCQHKVIRPVDPPEAWAVGVTYKRQAKEHDKDLKKKNKKFDSLYQFVYENERAEVFFKGMSRTIVGPYDDLWLRPDSSLIMPEAEMVLILGRGGDIIGITLGNDLTAWDIECECPLYLNQAKIWQGSGSIGPYIVPVEDVRDLYDLELTCVVERAGEEVLRASGNTSGLKRSVEELGYYLCMANPVQPGTVFYTGTACVIDHDFSLKEKDFVEISNSLIGGIRNPVSLHSMSVKDFISRGD